MIERYKQNEKEEILNLLKLMYTILEISKITKKDIDTIRNIILQLRVEGLWSSQMCDAIKENVTEMLNRGITPEEINKKTGICYEFIVELKKNIKLNNGKEENKKIIEKIKILLYKNAPISEILNYRAMLPQYWREKANKIIIYNMWEQGLNLDEINFTTGIKTDIIEEYINEFIKDEKKDNKEDELKSYEEDDEDEEYTKHGKLNPMEYERMINEKTIYKIIEKMQSGNDEPKDLEKIMKIVKYLNVSTETMNDLIVALINTGKMTRLKTAEYCINIILSDEDTQPKIRRDLQKKKNETKILINKIDESIKRMSKSGKPNSDIARFLEIDERYVMQIKMQDEWTI